MRIAHKAISYILATSICVSSVPNFWAVHAANETYGLGSENTGQVATIGINNLGKLSAMPSISALSVSENDVVSLGIIYTEGSLPEDFKIGLEVYNNSNIRVWTSTKDYTDIVGNEPGGGSEGGTEGGSGGTEGGSETGGSETGGSDGTDTGDGSGTGESTENDNTNIQTTGNTIDPIPITKTVDFELTGLDITSGKSIVYMETEGIRYKALEIPGIVNDSTQYLVSEDAECGCIVNYELGDVETSVKSNFLGRATIKLPQNSKLDYDSSSCDKHSGVIDTPTIEYKLETNGDTGISYSVGTNSITLNSVKSNQVVTVVCIVKFGDHYIEKKYDVSVTSLFSPATAPEIVRAEYVLDTSSGINDEYVEVEVAPHNNSSAKLYFDGMEHNIIFDTNFWGNYVNKTIKIPYQDLVDPSAVSSVSLKRATDGSKSIIVSWKSGFDANNTKVMYVTAAGGTSGNTYLDIKSDKTTKEIILTNKSSDGTTESKSFYTDADSEYSIPFSEFKWGSNLAIQVEDGVGNHSGIITKDVANNIIYSTTVVNDTLEIEEASIGVTDPKVNDTHDPWFPKPELKEVTLTAGTGKVMLTELTNIGDVPPEWEGLVVQYASEDGTYAPATVQYTYEQVRDDIPAAQGLIDVTIKKRNQEPLAVDDPVSATESVNAKAEIEFTIPKELLLKNDTDRESPWQDLQITDVRNCSAGTAKIVNGDVVIDPISGFYGLLTFEYRISDGDLKSNNWAKVTVKVNKVDNPPTAHDGEYYMQLTEEKLVMTPNVTNPGNGWEFKGLPLIKKGDEVIGTSKAALSIQYKEDPNLTFKVPYLVLTIKDDTYFKDGDVLKITYTAKNVYGETSAVLTVNMTTGDDPLDMEGYLYVHRRPLALFAPTVHLDPTKTYLTDIELTSKHEMSYDLDHQLSHDHNNSEATKIPSYSLKGIRTWEWAVKTLDGEWTVKQFDASQYDNSSTKAREAGLAWIEAETNKVIANNYQKPVMVGLRVRDIDGPDTIGAWSEQRTILLSAVQMPPVALFTLDKSTYTVPSDTEFTMDINDLSYDSNGDRIKTWTWTLTAPNGNKLINEQNYNKFDKTTFSKTVADAIKKYVNKGTYNPEKPIFKLSLVVTEDTPQALKSDMYSVSFEVYKYNKPPEITDKPGADTSTIESSTLYQIDDGLDGTVGDNWGTAGNTTHKGKINFPGLFTIKDDQPLEQLVLNYLFEGEKVTKRSEYNEDAISNYFTKSYLNKKYKPFQSPFTGTVTAEGFKPGAYKLSVTVKDHPTGNGYPSNSDQTSYWMTYATRAPFHFYVVPKLDLFMHNKVNGWIDQSIRESDGKTYTEVGLELSDIAPTIGDTIELYGDTNQFVTSLWGYNDINDNNKFDVGIDHKFIFTKTSSNLDGTKTWESSYTIEDIEDAPEGSDFTVLNLRIVGETNWGSETGETTRTKQIKMDMQVIPVKLYDFRVTEVTDPDISGEFKDYVGTLSGLRLSNGSVMDGIPVGHLAVDNNTTSSLLRKGYSFYYKVSSKGLKKDTDEVRIFPRFYAVNTDEEGNITSIGEELYGYVPNPRRGGLYEIYTDHASDDINEVYELFYEGSKIHSLYTHEEVRIPTSLRTMQGSEQTWSGRYGIPAEAKFFRSGSTTTSANEYLGDILVTFDIKAYKNGKPRYDYVERGQWLKERKAVPNSMKELYAEKEAEWKANNIYLGTVIVYNGQSSIKDNYISNPVWRE